MELLARLAGCDLRLQRNMCLVSVDESGGVEDCAAIWTLAPKESGCQCSVFSLDIQRNFRVPGAGQVQEGGAQEEGWRRRGSQEGQEGAVLLAWEAAGAHSLAANSQICRSAVGNSSAGECVPRLPRKPGLQCSEGASLRTLGCLRVHATHCTTPEQSCRLPPAVALLLVAWQVAVDEEGFGLEDE